MSIESMKQALEVLEQINQLSIGENAISLPGEIDGAMDALRAAVEQAEKQEPHRLTEWGFCKVCKHDKIPGEGCARKDCPEASAAPMQEPYGYFKYDIRLDAWAQSKTNQGVPFYTAPRQWVGLTDEEYQIIHSKNYNYEELALAVEAKLKEKNGI